MSRPLNSRCKELVASLLNYFEKERENNGPLIPLSSRVADALNLSINTVCKVSQRLAQHELLKTKKKRCYAKRVTNTKLLDTSDIRNAVYDMYEKKEHVTLSSLLDLLKRKQLFDGCKMSLCTILKSIGFRWKKDNPRRGLMELSHIALKRWEFLRSYMKEKEEGLYQFVFLDETWIFQNGTVGRSWEDDKKKSVKTKKVDGERFIILHVGNENGFVQGAEAIFASKTQLSDYHGEMNQENFLKWFENQLLRNLQQPSAIVIDNTPYHSMLLTKIPNSSWTKAAIQEWLTTKNIQFSNMIIDK